MKKIVLAVLALCMVLTVSCKPDNSDNKSENASQQSSDEQPEQYEENYDDAELYNVYQWNAMGSEPDEFSLAMWENPLNEKMEEEKNELNASSVTDCQAFYNKYLKIWREEMNYSIDNLKTYLSDEKKEEFDNRQLAWEKSLEENISFDRSMLDENKISLNGQFVPSSLMYLLEEFQERTYHIKYLTYLNENYADSPIAEASQLWNKFHDPEQTNTENLLSDSEASEILGNIICIDKLKFMFFDDEEYLGESACSIKAYYDMGDYITTEGHYLVLRDSGRVFKLDSAGVEYYEITETAESSPFPEYKSYMQNSSYEKVLNDNPIDKDYSETYDDTIYATLDIVKRESKYADLWQAEIDNALEILTESLSSEKSLERLPENLPDKDMVKTLTESQANWEQYCKSCISLAEGGTYVICRLGF